jgi:hypothetical protein
MGSNMDEMISQSVYFEKLKALEEQKNSINQSFYGATKRTIKKINHYR